MTLSAAAKARLAQLAPGLNDEPFAPAKVDAFDNNATADPVAVDGFCTMAGIDQHLAGAAAAGKTALIAIVGQTGTGRSLAARYVLEKWRQMKNLAPGRLLVPNIFQNIEELHYGHYEIFKQWMSLLREDGWDLGVIPKEAYEGMKTATAAADKVTYAADLRQAARLYAGHLHANGASYALLLEDVPSGDYLASPKLMFPNAGVICVCTIKDNAKLDPQSKGWMPLRLSPIGGNETLNFVSSLWNKHTQSALPFDVNVLRGAFAGRSDTIMRVRTLMSQVLINKLEAADGQWSFTEAFARAEAGS
jgi:hypothetical protein